MGSPAFTIAIVVGITISLHCVPKGWAETFADIPDGVRIANTNALFDRAAEPERVRGYEKEIQWPSSRIVRRYRPPERDVPPSARAKIDAWLRRVLKPELVPPDLAKRLIPLRGYFDGHDYFIVRYRVGDKMVQIFCGKYFNLLVSDPSLRGEADQKQRRMDLGAKKYLNCPDGLVLSPRRRFTYPAQIGRGMWVGYLGSPQNPPTSSNWERTWYEGSICLRWEQYLYVEAPRWKSYHGLHGVPVRSGDRDHPVNPDWQDFSRDKYYVLFKRHPNWWLILTTAFLATCAACGYRYLSMFRSWHKLRESATDARGDKQ